MPVKIKIPKRIVVIGSSCAGKTTFASKLAATLGSKHIELDALHWEANWKEADDRVFRSRVAAAVDANTWVVDGNYNKIKDLVWPLADMVIWLDPPLPVILRRFFFRSFTRCFKGELLWGHSRETLRNNIFSRNSLLVWILTTHKRRTEAYVKLTKEPGMIGVGFRLRTEQQVRDFLQRFAKSLDE